METKDRAIPGYLDPGAKSLLMNFSGERQHRTAVISSLITGLALSVLAFSQLPDSTEDANMAAGLLADVIQDLEESLDDNS